jgi:hypothetical protein
MDKDIKALDAALTQYQQAAHAAEPQGFTIAGITVVDSDGKQLGILPLSANAIRRLTGAIEAATYFATDHADTFLDDEAKTERFVIADVQDLFDGIDPQSLLDGVFGGPDAEASLAAFEEITGEWDGGQL